MRLDSASLKHWSSQASFRPKILNYFDPATPTVLEPAQHTIKSSRSLDHLGVHDLSVRDPELESPRSKDWKPLGHIRIVCLCEPVIPHY